MQGEKPTFKPLPIMRLTALLPPPPTPTTLILADSIGENEQPTTPRWCLRDGNFRLALEEEQVQGKLEGKKDVLR